MSFAKFAMGQGEVRLEIGPSLVNIGLALPDFAILQGHAGCEEKLRGGGDDLGGGIGSIAGGGIVEGVFDLVEEAFDWLVGTVGGLDSDVVVMEVGCRDESVLGLKMLKDVARGHI